MRINNLRKLFNFMTYPLPPPVTSTILFSILNRSLVYIFIKGAANINPIPKFVLVIA